ncbi:unnamed protein product [Phytophthora fragariaefolia]|uniref:Unnamed protein product n=1 Tax=Phytophthora fragariaefolia TaxID=1490495 RepID=A0A9W6WTT6_9STRA|nr:unnamed protein product [Phytophthora fragariaefolia]
MAQDQDARRRSWMKFLGSGSDMDKAHQARDAPPERGLSQVEFIAPCPTPDSFYGWYPLLLILKDCFGTQVTKMLTEVTNSQSGRMVYISKDASTSRVPKYQVHPRSVRPMRKVPRTCQVRHAGDQDDTNRLHKICPSVYLVNLPAMGSESHAVRDANQAVGKVTSVHVWKESEMTPGRSRFNVLPDTAYTESKINSRSRAP